MVDGRRLELPTSALRTRCLCGFSQGKRAFCTPRGNSGGMALPDVIIEVLDRDAEELAERHRLDPRLAAAEASRRKGDRPLQLEDDAGAEALAAAAHRRLASHASPRIGSGWMRAHCI